MVRTFSDTWDAIEALLQANAATLGVDVGAITKGDRETPARTPFLTVYLYPSDIENSESGASGFRATCYVIAGVEPKKTFAESIKSAVSLASKVVAVMKAQSQMQIFPSKNLIEFDEESSVYTAISVAFTVPYKLL